MEYVRQIFSFDLMGLPVYALLVATLIIMLTLVFRKIFTQVVLKYFDNLAQKSETDIDDPFVKSIEGPVRMGILGIGIFFSKLFLTGYIESESLLATIDNGIQLYFIIVICWFLYRSVNIIISYLQKLASRTPTELDDILLPYIQKLIKVILIALVIFKIAEIVLGLSITALLGILGGMGLTLGLVFKDIVANWFGCAVIYMDKLFQEGDWVMLNDGKVVDADVEEIGLRSTKFRNFDKTVSIVPNGLIAESVVKNWSRMYKRRVKYNFKIDGIHSELLEKVLDGIRNILSNDPGVHQEFHMVNFREIEGNSRIIRLYYFTQTTVWREHEQVRENVNLKILKLFEELNVSRLNYTIVDLSDDRPRDFSVNVENNN